MSTTPVGAPGEQPAAPAEGSVSHWVDEARRDPRGLTELIAGQRLELYQTAATLQEALTYLHGMDSTVRADLRRGTLSSTSAAALEMAGVPMEGLTAAIQHGIRTGQWSLWSGATATFTSELHGVFGQAAADWQGKLAAARTGTEEIVSQRQAALDDYETFANRMRPGAGSTLAPFAFPQDNYIGEALAADPECSHRDRAFPRWLMQRAALPDRPWGSLPWIDLCDTNLVFFPDGSSLTYAAATAAAQGIVTDQMSKSAPNRLKITWIDALHNGQSAGPLLRLAESGSRIIDGQIWTDPSSIESALLRIVDRMAAIERVCLRDEFQHLDTYNNQPGIAPEAHQIVVVSGYPTGFRESSAHLLRQISENGTRAGVCLIVIMDTSMAALIRLVDAVAPSYAQLSEGEGLATGPLWWSPALMPVGQFIFGHAGQPYACVTTLPHGEHIWVPCKLRSVDRAVQASIISGYAQASRQMAETGLSPREMAAKQMDPAARTASLRYALIRWLSEQEVTNQFPPGWDGFVRSDAAQRTGSAYSMAEIARQASYLFNQGYITAGADAPDDTGMSFPRLTPKGGDMVMSGGSSADDFARNSGRSSSQTNNIDAPVFSNVNEAQINYKSRGVTQNQTIIHRVTSGFEELAEAVEKTLTQLPRFGLTAEDSEDASASATDILVEVGHPSPDRGKIRRSLAALRGILQPIASQAAIGAGEASHDLARAALEHLQQVRF
jgi:hypothetical protein